MNFHINLAGYLGPGVKRIDNWDSVSFDLPELTDIFQFFTSIF